MKKVILFAILFLCSLNLLANGLSLNSIGPKALGMGGAFVGLADDPTAIYWNPAGLVGQSNGLLVTGADIIPFASYNHDDHGIDAETNINHYASPNIFANYNMGDFALGFGAYVPAGLGAEWDGEDLVALGGPAFLDTTQTIENPFAGKKYEWISEIGVFNFSPALAYKLSEKFSVGAAMNIYYGMMELKRAEDKMDVVSDIGNPQQGEDELVDTQTAFDISGLGYGATISLRWKCLLNDKLDWGLSIRTPTNVAFEGKADIFMDLNGDGQYDLLDRDLKMDIEWPLWIGFGGAYQAKDNMILTFDVQYSKWSSLDILTAEIEMPDTTGGTVTQEQEMHLEWEDAIQIRLGTQYSISEQFDLRGGFYYDPAPAPDETLNILFPSSTNYVLTTGCGYKTGNFNFDFGIEYLFGQERDVTKSDYNMPGKHQMDVFAFSIGAGYSF